jgi:hypothetical protein
MMVFEQLTASFQRRAFGAPAENNDRKRATGPRFIAFLEIGNKRAGFIL